MKKIKQDLNVFGHKIEKCSLEPLTGAYRDGCCNTGPSDYGTHSVCAVVDDKFLRFSKLMGSDLVSDNPKYNFKGLKPGDKWCLCVSRWIQAYNAGCAPKVILESTNIKTLEYISLNELSNYSINYQE